MHAVAVCSRCCYCQPFERDIIHIKLSFSALVSGLLEFECNQLSFAAAGTTLVCRVNSKLRAANEVQYSAVLLWCRKCNITAPFEIKVCKKHRLSHSINNMHVGHVSQLLFWFFPTQKHTRSEFHSELRWLEWKIVASHSSPKHRHFPRWKKSSPWIGFKECQCQMQLSLVKRAFLSLTLTHSLLSHSSLHESFRLRPANALQLRV